MELLVANITGKTRYDTLNGQKYLVAPMSLITPGVLSGSKGPMYYPVEEVIKNASDWNGIPIVAYHPYVNGSPTSARDPDILNSQGIGFVFRSKGKNKLTAEGWFHIEDTRRVDNRILDSLEAEEQITLSTGLYPQVLEPAEEGATFNGVAYDFTARDYKPDHLAILPDQKGACSIQDGCGVLVNKETRKTSDPWVYTNEDGKECTFHFAVTNALHEISHSELYDLLSKQLRAGFTQEDPNVWISEVFDTYIVYWFGDNLFRLSYTKSTGTITLSSETPQKVVRETSFITVTNKEVDMAKKELVDNLIANCDCWNDDEGSRKVLNNMDDAQVTKLIESAKESKSLELIANAASEVLTDTHKFDEKSRKFEPLELGKKVAEEKVKGKVSLGVTNPTATLNIDTISNPNKPQTEAEWLSNAPAGIQSAVQNAMRIEERERGGLIDNLVVNVEGEDDQKRLRTLLATKPLDELEALSLLTNKTETAHTNSASLASFFGQAGGPIVANKGDEELESLPLPAIDYSTPRVN